MLGAESIRGFVVDANGARGASDADRSHLDGVSVQALLERSDNYHKNHSTAVRDLGNAGRER